MSQVHQYRSSPSKYLDRVWKSRNTSNGIYKATPDGCWDLIVCIDGLGARSIMLTGQASHTSSVPYQKNTSSVVLSFAAGVYLPDMPGPQMLDLVEYLPNDGPDHFVLLGHRFEIPTFENAEQLVLAMEAKQLLAIDEIVAAVLAGTPKAMSDRSMQRHFIHATGLTKKFIDQIHRSQHAVSLLKAGETPADVASSTGYTDQPHMARSLRKIMRIRPSQVDDIHKL